MATPAVKVDNLVKRYPTAVAVDGIFTGSVTVAAAVSVPLGSPPKMSTEVEQAVLPPSDA